MLITIYHNEFQKELEIKEDDSMGHLLEKFLQCCNLLIYNIEYCTVTLNIKKTHDHDNQHKNDEEENDKTELCSFILGSNELPFSLTVQSMTNVMKAFSIEKFELIDRKRDEHGNVIKNNVYLDEYQKWYQERESTNYIEYMNNQTQYVENNRNQFMNIFQEFNQQLQDQLNNQGPNSNLGNLHNQMGVTGASFLGNSQENNMQGPMFLFQNIMNNYNQNTNYIPVSIYYYYTPNLIPNNNSSENFSSYIRRLFNNISGEIYNYNNLNENNDFNENNNLNENNDFNENNIIFDVYYNIQFPSSQLIERIFSDYLQNKNRLTENEYNDNIEKINDKIIECPICFSDSETSIKIKKCNHLFCEDCIKKWLIEHKNTCPVCRVNLKCESNESNENN